MKQGWEYKKLEDVASFQRGLTYSSEDEVDFSTKCVLRSNNINLENSCLDLSELKYLREDFIIPNDRMFCDNSIFICMSNGSKQHIGKVAYIKEKINYAFGGFMGLIVPNQNIQSKFVFYNLRSPHFKIFLNSIGEGANIKNLRFSDLSKYKIPVPPLPTQQAIVSELDTLSGIIAECKETLKDYDSLEQSIFYDMFGDPVKNEKGWEVREMGSICEVTSFKRVLIEDVVDEGIPFVRGTELTEMCGLTRGEQMKFSLYITQEHYDRVKKITGVPSIGDLLIPSINSKGYVWIVNTTAPMYYKDGRVLWIHLNSDCFRSEYLQKTISTILLDSYSLMASGATFAELKLFILRELNVPVPPIELQQQFADKINAIEQMKEETKKALQEAETLFQARMDYWFG